MNSNSDQDPKSDNPISITISTSEDASATQPISEATSANQTVPEPWPAQPTDTLQAKPSLKQRPSRLSVSSKREDSIPDEASNNSSSISIKISKSEDSPVTPIQRESSIKQNDPIQNSQEPVLAETHHPNVHFKKRPSRLSVSSKREVSIADQPAIASSPKSIMIPKSEDSPITPILRDTSVFRSDSQSEPRDSLQPDSMQSYFNINKRRPSKLSISNRSESNPFSPDFVIPSSRRVSMAPPLMPEEGSSSSSEEEDDSSRQLPEIRKFESISSNESRKRPSQIYHEKLKDKFPTVNEDEVVQVAMANTSGNSLPRSIAQSGRTSATSHGNGLDHPMALLYRIRDEVKAFYHKHVSYKKETWLHLIALFPFALLAAGVYLIPFIVFSSSIYATLYKLALILVGSFAVSAAEIINHRHSAIGAITKILNGGARGLVVPKATKNGFSSGVLEFAAFLSYCCLLATKMAVLESPVPTTAGLGTSAQVTSNLSAINELGGYNPFSTVIASTLGCQKCAGIYSTPYNLVPVTSHLKQVEDENLMTVTDSNVQDIMAVTTNCVQEEMNTAPYAIDSMFIGFKVRGIIPGIHSTAIKYSLFTLNDKQSYSTVACTTTILEKRGYTKVFYVLHDGFAVRDSVSSIKEYNSSCEAIGDYCLNEPSIPGLSYALLNSALESNGNYSIPRSLNFLPQIQKNLLLSVTELELTNIFSQMLVLAAVEFTDRTTSIEVQSHELSVVLKLDPTLVNLTFGIAAFCVFYATILIVSDVIQVENIPNELIVYMAHCLEPGFKNLTSMCKYIVGLMDNPDVPIPPEWTTPGIRFGEDRATVGTDKGILRFGLKKDLVRFKKERYYD